MGRREDVRTVIPVYNHGATLREVVCGALRQGPSVVVVDDGSTDMDVPALLAGLEVTLLTHPRNAGKGAALRTAARHLAGLGVGHMITLDADGQHDPADIAAFLPHLSPEAMCLVVGDRDFSAARIPWRSRVGRILSNLLVRLEAGVTVTDSQSGFRAYPVSLLAGLPCRAGGYAYEVEALVRGCWAGVRVVHVPVSVGYPEPSRRITHFRVVADTLAAAWLHVRLLALLPWRRGMAWMTKCFGT
jgi:glycosyltransferase involved in cell wall biosynthesis